MPTLDGPEEQEAPTIITRLRGVAATVAGTTVSIRVLVFLGAAVLGASLAPVPWSQIGLLGIVGVAIEMARKR